MRNLDPRQAAAVDSAYFQLKPPDAVPRKRRPPLHEYVRHLVYSRLSEASVLEVLKKLLKLPWAQCERYVLKCLLKVVRGRWVARLGWR